MVDAHAATALKLYIDNDGDLYRQQTTSIRKNLITKRARGEYKHDLAVKAFGYLVEAGVKKYAHEFGSPSQPWHKMFNGETRKQVAEELTEDFEAAAKAGDYDWLLPKKYQKPKASGTGHARKKLQWKTPEGLKVAWSPVNQAYFALWPGRGKIEDQQVLKIGSAEEMHGWLRDTYGEAYGLAGRGGRGSKSHARKRDTSARQSRAGRTSSRPGISAYAPRDDLRDFRGFLRNASDSQVQGIYEKEKSAGRDQYAELAVAEADRRGILFDEPYNHARRRDPGRSGYEAATPRPRAQIEQEIARSIGPQAYAMYRGRR